MSFFGLMVRHTGESRYPGFFILSSGLDPESNIFWIPAFAGMTGLA
jgi:hypothetical protein